jgi:chromate transport protein ChrA
MTPQLLFGICSKIALLGWVGLVFGGRVRVILRTTAFAIPTTLCLVYAFAIIGHWHERTGGFGSLSQLHDLFQNPWLLLAGWVHYLAFDLLVGAWECTDAQKRQISHFLVIPCLLLTSLFGPIGFLLYLCLRITLHNQSPPGPPSGAFSELLLKIL